MLHLLTSAQIREADAYTIGHEPISSLDLMERAAAAFVKVFTDRYPDKAKNIAVYCGTGNNGGDGLAIARMLCKLNYKNTLVKIARYSDKPTNDFIENLKRLKSAEVEFEEIRTGDKLPVEKADIIIDALLGSGLNKPLKGDYEKLVKYLNGLNRTIVSVDVPTGFFCEGEISNDAVAIKSKLSITFQQPKINFLVPESAPYIEEFSVVDIGLSNGFIASLNSPYQLIAEQDIRSILKPRKTFTHKGTYGQALIIAGQPETMGAALLCSSACAHAGAGLTTACIPKSGLTALNTSMPEVMAIVRAGVKEMDIEWDKFSTIAIGPGLGKKRDTLALLKEVLQKFDKPVVVDADALNLLAANPELLKQIPKGSIITPHMKEFDRLFGANTSWWGRLETIRQKAKEHQINIVLKNQYTITGTPDGKLYFNQTGNPAMASGGMGDVLTGVITALLAQKYTPEQACILGTYLHGKSGDDLALPNKKVVVLAGEVAKHIPVVMAKFRA
ncbi:NAD(P)H-hydrate dehydratase [Mucilaginibacter sp. HMF5004]|uniref:NAD(P)H-hydrate dehydratase n=1 Tax=Mucilaginibacter rivuli TaxID=2857527 RepID=UPI001C603367|nr:NAD(P)H-hydrate dehydratase [Mucilaginibacter rivuli]MBW4891173.1 NAD(P)H-hydrate dehydratase [Mucilaginibacter rivuli]